MAQGRALKELSGTGEHKENTEGVVSARPAQAVFRNGYWYSGEIRCKDYRDALKRTLLAAGFPCEKPPKPRQKFPTAKLSRPERLETRVWWEAFLDARAIREARRIADEQAAREAEAERIWAEIRSGQKFPTAKLSRTAGA